jgi:arylsulfatase A-like enzyme
MAVSASVLVACRDDGRPPDVVLVCVDTLRADYLGAYGFEGDVSPNLDAITSSAYVFEYCFAQAPWTKPATASILTSLYPSTHGLTNHDGKYWGSDPAATETGILSDEAVTLAEAFQSQGYRTGAFIANPWLQRDYGFAQGFDVYDDFASDRFPPAKQILQQAQLWVQTIPFEQPVFVYVHLMDVHAPYDAPKADYDVVSGSPSLGSDVTLPPEKLPFKKWQNLERRPDWATDEMRSRVSYWRSRYASGVREIDRDLGEFVQALRDAGRWDTSWFALTSDHGEELFEHGDWSHGYSLHEHQLRIPWILRPPGGCGRTQRVPDLVQQVDIMPTLLALADIPSPEGVQGKDLSGVLAPTDAAHVATEEIVFGSSMVNNPNMRAVRTRRYKLLLDVHTNERWLYDMSTDPGETIDIAASHPDIADQLEKEILRHLAKAQARGSLEVKGIQISPERLEEMKALGYF